MSTSDNIILANKPAGMSTHSPGGTLKGYSEYLSDKLGTKLYVCHRLDRQTSGALILAKDKETTSYISKLFQEKEVQKKYTFVTDCDCEHETMTHQSEITKDKKYFISINSKNPNSKTNFSKIKAFGKYTLWQAEPISGKTHQIRLHAKDLGIPILGDDVYGKTNFPRLMLHATELSFMFHGKEIVHAVTPSVLFTDQDFLNDHLLADYISAIDRRVVLYDLDNEDTDTWRLMHTDVDRVRCDKLGKYLWFYWYQDCMPDEQDIDRIKQVSKQINSKGYKVQIMKNRGNLPEPTESLSNIDQDSWTAKENGITYMFKKDQGYSPGLFLDQRQNRRWVLNNSLDKQVLNLFCYTAGFSVSAALGQASQVVSVDTSKTTLEWAKENFKLNGLDPNEYEFWSQDARYFIKGCLNRSRKFDLIICDPPSFARNKQSVFSLEKEFDSLVISLNSLLNQDAHLLLSLNFEKWKEEDIKEKLLQVVSGELLTLPEGDLDYELPGESRLMKSFLIKKIS